MLGKKQGKEILEACHSPFKLRKDHSPRSIWVTPLGVRRSYVPSTSAKLRAPKMPITHRKYH